MRFYSYILLSTILFLGGCGAIPDQGGNSRDSGVYTSTGPDAAPIIFVPGTPLTPQEADNSDSSSQRDESAPNPSTGFDQQVTPYTDEQPTPGLEMEPVVLAPDTLPYNDPGGGGPIKDPCIKGPLKIEVSGSFESVLDVIHISGTLIGGENDERTGMLGCTVQIWQDIETPLETKRALASGDFDFSLNEYSATSTGQGDETIAVFFLQAISNTKDPQPISEVVRVDVIFEIGEMIHEHTRSEKNDAGPQEYSGSPRKPEVPNTGSPPIIISTSPVPGKPPASNTSPVNVDTNPAPDSTPPPPPKKETPGIITPPNPGRK